MRKWQHLMDLLDKKHRILNGFNELLGMFREIESISIELKDMEVSIFKRAGAIEACYLRVFSCIQGFIFVSLSPIA